MIPPGPASHTHDTMDRQRGLLIAAQNETRAALREVEAAQRKSDLWEALAVKHTNTLATIRELHQPDPDNNHACQCGLSNPCPTRRSLDGGTT